MPPQTTPTPQVPPEQPNSPAVTPQPVVTPQPISPTPAPNKKRIPVWIKIVIVAITLFIILIVLAAVAAMGATKAPQKVSDQFVNDIQASDTSAAYALTSKTFQQATSQDALSQIVGQVGPILQGEEKVTGRAIEKTTGTGQTAVLVYTVKTTNNGTKYIKVQLQKSGDNWQVVNFRSSDTSLETKVE